GLVPLELSRAGSGKNGFAVLRCESSGMVPQNMLLSLGEMATSGQRAKWTVITYSFWYAYQRSAEIKKIIQQKGYVFHRHFYPWDRRFFWEFMDHFRFA